MKKIDQVKALLSTREWVSGVALNRVQSRFGASILILRRGDNDGKCWVIEKRTNGFASWEYRLTGFAESYDTKSPHCLDCGSKRVFVRDDRRSK